MKRSVLSLTLLSLGFLAGCQRADGPTTPVAPLTLSISAESMVGHYAVAGSDTLYACTFQLTFSVSGGQPGEQIAWDGGAVDFWIDAGIPLGHPSPITSGVDPLPGDLISKVARTSGFSAGQAPLIVPLTAAFGVVPVPFNAQVVAGYHVVEPGGVALADQSIATAALSCK